MPEELVNTQNAVLISFVLHGFTQQNREKIVKNARELLKENGKLYIIDYPPMDVEKAPFFAKFFLTKLECPLALDYIKRDRDAFLKKMGFEKAFEKMYFKGLISLSAFYKK